MAVSDLTNTTWVFDDENIYSGSSFNYSINFITKGNSYTSIRYAWSQYSTDELFYNTTNVCDIEPAERSYWENQGYRAITITGGTDVTNATLISWLEGHAIQITVSNLTNTTWLIDNELNNWISGYYHVNFTSNNNNYTLLEFDDDVGYGVLYNDNLVYSYENNPKWSNQAYRTITITGGTDVTNNNLINWLAANATQQVDEPDVTYDLTQLDGYLVPGTSYTVTAKAVAAGYADSVASNSVTYVPSEPQVQGYLTFESDDGSEFTLGTDADSMDSTLGYVFSNDGTLEYSTDTVNWTTWTPTTTLNSSNGKLYIRGTNNTYLSQYSSCFLAGTEITLADGSKKNVEDIEYSDELKVWNFDTGEYDTASICWLTKPKLKNYHYYQLTFSDGTILKTTGQRSNHKVYNVDERYFKGVNVTEVGDRIFTENGIVTVTNKERIEQEVLYYNLITSLRFGCFANGVLTSDRYGNIYPIDEDMKFIKGDREVRPYSEFEAVGISRYWYDNLRLGENTETLEETKKYIERLESQMRQKGGE